MEIAGWQTWLAVEHCYTQSSRIRPSFILVGISHQMVSGLMGCNGLGLPVLSDHDISYRAVGGYSVHWFHHTRQAQYDRW